MASLWPQLRRGGRRAGAGRGRPRRVLEELLAGEAALHAEAGVARHGAQVGVLALLDRGRDRGRLARLEHRRLLAGDLEVVRDLALVGHLEGDLAGLRALGGKSEAE